MEKEWKIYTRTGDLGHTSLIGGRRVPKYHDKIEAYGTVDELCAFIGVIRDHDIDAQTRSFLIKIQENLFVLEALLAADPNVEKQKLPSLFESDITALEVAIDEMNTNLNTLTTFILPGGNVVVSYCHVARTICRRAERAVLKLFPDNPVDPICQKYLNRLSDYLFVLARKLSKDLNAEEKPWIPII
ncbi:MAG: cob(I)yrinic acid a,c-diamide adenosyltransferase [Bacteroidetes bacterium]|nr:cob(I)yrinic acid a,c-diamide adenosyltransferase [Bacteroidota bacterium]